MLFMLSLILPLVVVLIYVLGTTYWNYRRGKLVFSPKATRAEKNIRHLVTLVTLLFGLLLVFGLNYGNVLSDRGLEVGGAMVIVIALLRSMMVELGLRRVDSEGI